jgi:hypothetical protein
LVQFWEPPEIFADHSSAEPIWVGIAGPKRPTQPSRREILAVRERSGVTCAAPSTLNSLELEFIDF